MANFGINVWDRSGVLGNGSNQRLAQLQFYGTVNATSSIDIPDIDMLEVNVSLIFGIWDTINGGPDNQARSFLTFSYNPSTRIGTITNTSGANQSNVVLITW